MMKYHTKTKGIHKSSRRCSRWHHEDGSPFKAAKGRCINSYKPECFIF